MLVNTRLLKQQIRDLLNSNIKENSKTGLHHLLGEILDELLENRKCIICKSEGRYRKNKNKSY